MSGGTGLTSIALPRACVQPLLRAAHDAGAGRAAQMQPVCQAECEGPAPPPSPSPKPGWLAALGSMGCTHPGTATLSAA